MSKGYNTRVGERGVTLSGGQKQRIAIARALLMNPRLLILDDATASVDTETEHLIQQAFERLMQGRTTFVIAHRLSTVRRADLILVLENGRIAARGTHDDLLQTSALYNQIYQKQLKAESTVAFAASAGGLPASAGGLPASAGGLPASAGGLPAPSTSPSERA
jgi:ATP-binding cassette subfamily B protein